VVVIAAVTIVPPRGVHRCSPHPRPTGVRAVLRDPHPTNGKRTGRGDRERLAPQSAPAIRSSN